MNMNVGDDCELAFLANIPQGSEATSIQPYNPGVQAVWIDVIVEFEINDSDSTVATTPEKERAALATAAASPRSQG
jgi:hypothetical protein